jgi:hypothetical protein
MRLNLKRAAVLALYLLAGAGIGEKMLLQEHEMHAATTVCGHPKYVRVVWSLPGQRDDDYSDDGAFVPDCGSIDPGRESAILQGMADPPHQPTPDEVNDNLRQITADDAAFAARLSKLK